MNINEAIKEALGNIIEGDDGADEVELVCPNCGTEVEIPSHKALQTPIEEMKCPNCGTGLEPQGEDEDEDDGPEKD